MSFLGLHRIIRHAVFSNAMKCAKGIIDHLDETFMKMFLVYSLSVNNTAHNKKIVYAAIKY